jgi:hypothetical protein
MRRSIIAGVVCASIVTTVALIACGDGSNPPTAGGDGPNGPAAGHDGPCSDSYGFLDFAPADGFTEAKAKLERHLGDGFPAPPPPDSETEFAVAQGTLFVAETGPDGTVRNVESAYKYGWLRYGPDDPPNVMVGMREIPFCEAQTRVLEEERVSTSAGPLEVLTMWVEGEKRTGATALFQTDGTWTLVNMEWPEKPPDGDDELRAWISAVVDASEQQR